ncbi:MAG: Ni-sirohydrochlorin a,c-diamide synthase [Methanoregula sp.]|nr:Ni-sirohydrochlorin a,c-diamide synthase [Methanoregula sp.]
MKAVLITGDRSGSGKTSITLALSSLLSRTHTVQTFKVGMDYIDPSYLSAVTGRPCRNIDSFTMDDSTIRQIYGYGCRGADMALVEGVRGLYEGAEALNDIGTTASIAKVLSLPVILVVSAQSITRSAAAIVKGFCAFDPGIRVAGVILNNIKGTTHKDKAVAAIEHYCGIPVIGAIPRMEEMQLTMRHLGLIPFREGTGRGDFDARVQAITKIIGEYVDLGHFQKLMADVTMGNTRDTVFDEHRQPDVRIGVALDQAFNFYYADLFDVLQAFGAEAIPFSPVHDRLPEAEGYIIGGGYPELFVKELESNEKMRSAVKEVSKNGVPIYAECGGLMYLTERMLLQQGWQGITKDASYEMCGVYAGETRMPSQRVVSYVEGSSTAKSVVGKARFRGHEFHYSDVVLDKNTHFAYQLTRGVGIRDTLDGAMVDNTLGSYTHLHPVASMGMFRHFIDRCRKKN